MQSQLQRDSIRSICVPVKRESKGKNRKRHLNIFLRRLWKMSVRRESDGWMGETRLISCHSNAALHLRLRLPCTVNIPFFTARYQHVYSYSRMHFVSIPFCCTLSIRRVGGHPDSARHPRMATSEAKSDLHIREMRFGSGTFWRIRMAPRGLAGYLDAGGGGRSV